jgi:hypothetical protein
VRVFSLTTYIRTLMERYPEIIAAIDPEIIRTAGTPGVEKD